MTTSAVFSRRRSPSNGHGYGAEATCVEGPRPVVIAPSHEVRSFFVMACVLPRVLRNAGGVSQGCRFGMRVVAHVPIRSEREIGNDLAFVCELHASNIGVSRTFIRTKYARHFCSTITGLHVTKLACRHLVNGVRPRASFGG